MAKSEGVSLGVTLLKLIFTAVKATFALLTGSIALIVESLHSAANVLTSLGVWWSLRLERQRAEGLLEEQEVALQRGAAWEAEAEGEYRDWRTQRYIDIKTHWEKRLAVLAGLALMGLAAWGLAMAANPPNWQARDSWWTWIGLWTNSGWVVPVVMGFLGLLTYFISRMEQQVGAIEGQEDFSAGSVRAKLDALGCALVAAVFILRNISDGQLDIDRIVGVAIGIVLLLQGLEIIVSAMMSQFEEQRIADFQEWDAEVGVGRLALGRLLSGSGWMSFFGFLSRGVSMQTGQQRPLRFLYRHLPALLGIAAGVFLVQSCFFIVPPQEAAIVERFGHALQVQREVVGAEGQKRMVWKSEDLLGEGLHLKLPWPIDHVVRVPVYEFRSEAFGFEEPPKERPFVIYEPQFHDVELVLVTKPPKPRSAGATLAESQEPGYLIVITLRIQYEIGDPAEYYGGTQDPGQLLDDEANYLLLTWARRQTVDELLAIDQETLTGDIHRKLNSRLAETGAGLSVQSVILLWIHPPVKEVQPKGGPGVPITVAKAYQTVAAAREAYKTKVLESINNRHKILPRARADAYQTAQEARSYRESTGLRSDLVVLRPTMHLNHPLLGNAEYLVATLTGRPELAPAGDSVLGTIVELPSVDNPGEVVLNAQFPGEPPVPIPPTDTPLAAGDAIERIRRDQIEAGTHVHNVDVRVMADGRVFVGTLQPAPATAPAASAPAVERIRLFGTGEVVSLNASQIAWSGRCDAMMVRPLVGGIECRVLDESDPHLVAVRIDYEYEVGPQAAKLPRTERIARSRIREIVRGGTESRMSLSQGNAAGFAALAETYNQDPAYQRLFRLRRSYQAIGEILPGTKKVVLGRGAVELWMNPKGNPLDVLGKELAGPEGGK